MPSVRAAAAPRAAASPRAPASAPLLPRGGSPGGVVPLEPGQPRGGLRRLVGRDCRGGGPLSGFPPGAYLRGGRDAKEAAKAKAAASSPRLDLRGGGGGGVQARGLLRGGTRRGGGGGVLCGAYCGGGPRAPGAIACGGDPRHPGRGTCPPHPLRAEAGYPDGGAEAPAVLLDAEVVPAEEAKVGGTGGEPGFSLRSRRVQLCLAVVVVAILGLAFGLGMSLGRGGGEGDAGHRGRGRGRSRGPLPPAPSAEQTGEEACEERGYGIQECLSVGCCEWDDGECFSAVEDSPCRPPAGGQGEARPAPGPGTVLPPTPVPVADLAILPNGEEACEERGYGIQECLSVGCCEWDDGECFSAVEDGPCAAAPAGAEAERTRPNGLDFSFSLSYSMSFSFDLSYLGSASYDWGIRQLRLGIPLLLLAERPGKEEGTAAPRPGRRETEQEEAFEGVRGEGLALPPLHPPGRRPSALPSRGPLRTANGMPAQTCAAFTR